MESRDIYKLIVQNILQYVDEGIHVIDKKGKTILYNEAMAQLEGLEMDMVLNKDLLEVFPSLNEDTSTLLTVMKTGRPILDKLQTYLNYKGEKITTVNTTIPLFINEERIGAIEIAKDVTKIKKLSEQLLDLQQELIGKNESNGKSKIPKYTFNNIIGNSKELRKAIDLAKKASKSASSVLIYGETGTGKELFAQSIHYYGNRKDKPFIAQNCAALPESLLEGILFGTVKGGFTGAVDRPGLFEQANGGTLLLDEINSMGLTLQTKLLRVLQEGYIRRVGGLKDIPIDVKVIATTNEDPMEAIKNGNLRKDLYYRLNVISIKIPPLRERKEDIRLLCDYFINKYNKKLNKRVCSISQDIINDFQKHDWPGNVRELENMIEASMNCVPLDEQVLRKEYFPIYIANEMREEMTYINEEIRLSNSLPDILSSIEKKIILKKLDEFNYNITKAARSLKINRQTLQHKMKRYGINR
jgi:arginine utilization regulatory protein